MSDDKLVKKDDRNMLEKVADGIADGVEDIQRTVHAQGGVFGTAKMLVDEVKKDISGATRKRTGVVGHKVLGVTADAVTDGAKGVGNAVKDTVVKHAGTDDLPEDGPIVGKILYGIGSIAQKAVMGVHTVVGYVIDDIKGPNPLPQLDKSVSLLETYIRDFKPYNRKVKADVKDVPHIFALSYSDKGSGADGSYKITTTNEKTELGLTFTMVMLEDLYECKRDLKAITKSFPSVAYDLINSDTDEAFVEIDGKLDGTSYTFTARLEKVNEKDVFSIEYSSLDLPRVTFEYSVVDQ